MCCAISRHQSEKEDAQVPDVEDAIFYDPSR